MFTLCAKIKQTFKEYLLCENEHKETKVLAYKANNLFILFEMYSLYLKHLNTQQKTKNIQSKIKIIIKKMYCNKS